MGRAAFPDSGEGYVYVEKGFFRSTDIIFQRWQMAENLYCELAYRFIVGSWYKKAQNETYNLTKLISRLKEV